MTTHPFDLSQRVAIVTGGNKGIGKGIALALAAAGARLHLTGRDQAAGAATVDEIKAAGGHAEFHTADVNDDETMGTIINQAAESALQFGADQPRIDILVNNAGISKADGPPEQLSDENWNAVIDTNLNSVFKCSRAVHPFMTTDEPNSGGKIINIGSMYSLFGTPMIPNYAASKGAIVQLTKSLATAWAHNNIQVNCILPGWISTDLTKAVEENAEFTADIMKRTPAGRFGTPEDLGGTAVFLASSATGFLTGQSIAVCGGYSIA